MNTSVIFQALYQRYQSLFLTTEESARELRIHPSTARVWISEGRFPCQTTVMNGRRLVSLGALVEFMVHESGIADPEREEKNNVEPGSQQTSIRSQTEVVGVEVNGEIKKGRPSHLERAAAEAAGLSVRAYRQSQRG